jgi:hypothetical protein
VKHLRPNQIWWLGIGLFAPSILIWALTLGLFIYKGDFYCPFDWFGIRHIYLPLFAALLGFAVPLSLLKLLKLASWRVNLIVFICYAVVFLAWAVIDIRNQNYQMSVHYKHPPLASGERCEYYSHNYFTWYFMPYRAIERID